MLKESLIRGNNCGNCIWKGGDCVSIHVTGSKNRIDYNNVADNDWGILVDANVNLIFRNRARNNLSGNYDIVANNSVGTIVIPPFSGAITTNGPSAGSEATYPFANFAF